MRKIKNILLYFADKYAGNWQRIITALRSHEPVSPAQANAVRANYGKFFTVMCEEYPDSLKLAPKPPFVVFYKGDLRLLAERKVFVAGGPRSLSPVASTTVPVLMGEPKTDVPGIYVVANADRGMVGNNQLLVSVKEGRTPIQRFRLVLAIADKIIVGRPTPAEMRLIRSFAAYGKAVYRTSAINEGMDGEWSNTLPGAESLAPHLH